MVNIIGDTEVDMFSSESKTESTVAQFGNPLSLVLSPLPRVCSQEPISDPACLGHKAQFSLEGET